MRKEVKDLKKHLKCSYLTKDLYLEYISSYNKSISKYTNNSFLKIVEGLNNTSQNV